jgi:DNA-binding NtrC family response regulator
VQDPEDLVEGEQEKADESNEANGTKQLTAVVAPSVPLKVVVVSGRDFGKSLILEKGPYRIGKGKDADLELTDPAVSRQHLVLEPLRGGCRFRDDGSRNGSFFGGSRFSVIEVATGGLVRIGETELQVMPVVQPTPFRPSENSQFGRLLGTSLAMRQTFAILERAAASDADVLLQGETGTGKELAAEGLHQAGPGAGGPFIICDLAGTAPTLIESELFGHVRGAFTGAVSDRAGAFERAHRGTLFLDEIGDLALDLQPRLLRALERRQVKRVGGNKYQDVEVRVVAATHKNLESEAKAGRFREDLFHRLAVVTVSLPPLRARLDDLPILVNAILARSTAGTSSAILSPETLTLLKGHDWPGNVRELRNVIERAVKLGIDPAVPARQSGERPGTQADINLPYKEAKDNLVMAFERDYLVALMQRNDGNVSQAGREAGIGRVYLHRLLKKHGLTRD